MAETLRTIDDLDRFYNEFVRVAAKHGNTETFVVLRSAANEVFIRDKARGIMAKSFTAVARNDGELQRRLFEGAATGVGVAVANALLGGLPVFVMGAYAFGKKFYHIMNTGESHVEQYRRDKMLNLANTMLFSGYKVSHGDDCLILTRD